MSSVNALYREITIPPFLNPGSISELLKQVQVLENEKINFIVFKGSDTIFCDGLDLKWVTQHAKSDHMKEMKEYGAFLKKIQTGSFISIALVKGSVSGGGMGIVCACDHVIADEKSTFSLPEGLLGLIPGMILPSLLNRMSQQRIKKMVFTGQKYQSKIALEWGIVDEIVQENNMDGALTETLNTMRSCKKGSISDLKTLLYDSPVNKDELAQSGMNILSDKLNDVEISERLKAIADFMREE